MNPIRCALPGHRSTLFVVALLALFSASVAGGATAVWTNTSSGAFSDAGNWGAGAVPGIADTASFTNAGISYGVQVIAAQSNTDAGVNGKVGSLVVGVAPAAAWAITNRLAVGSGISSSTMLLTGGVISAGAIVVGDQSGAHSNTLVVAGSQAVVTNHLAGGLILGNALNDDGNRLVVTNGGRVFQTSASGGLFLGNNGAKNGSVLVSGNGSLLQGAGSLYLAVSSVGSGNSMVVSNGGRVVSSGTATIGKTAGSSSNSVVITGSGSVWTNTAAFTVEGERNSLTVEQGGRLAVVGAALDFSVGAVASSSNNTVVVRDSGSLLSVGQSIYVGRFGLGGNLMVLADGAQATAGSQLHVGSAGSGNRLVISNGAQLVTSAGYSYIGSGVGSDSSSLRVTGPGSLLKSPRVYVGSNGFSFGVGASILIDDGGILETTRLTGGLAGSGNVSNLGGVYRFTAAVPSIASNASLLLLQNGTVEYLGVSGATTTLGQLTKQGSNALRLTTSTNATAATYAVGTGREFQELHLMGTNSRWAGAALLVTNGGAFVVTNALAATVEAALTNLGSVRVINSKVTYEKAVVLSGSYFSDPSTNIFTTNLTVTASGSVSGSNGDLFVFQRDFLNASTNAAGFSLSQAAVLFTNAASHLLSVSNSGSLNLGQGWTSFAQVASNFAIGQFSVAANNRVTVAGNEDTLTNALYVGWLDLQGINTNSYSDVTNGLFAALYLPNINLYYDTYDSRNDWLNANLIHDSAGGYNLWGGGLLMPIPEPSPALALGCGLALLGLLRCRRQARS